MSTEKHEPSAVCTHCAQAALDNLETLIAHLLCAENDNAFHTTGAKRGEYMEEIDAGAVLQFPVMRPKLAYTFDALDGDRLFTLNYRELLHSAPDIIGREGEVAIMKEAGYVQWVGFRRVNKVPRGVWVGGKVGAVYEMHWRDIYPSGESSYFRRVAAVSPSGAPLPCIIQGSQGNENRTSPMILAASIIEDVGRTGCFTTTVQDSAGIILPVPYGAQVELFKLRDAPLTPSGRRKAILHWVASHVRRRGDKTFDVSAHIRGVQEITMDGIKVRLEPNDEARKAA